MAAGRELGVRVWEKWKAALPVNLTPVMGRGEWSLYLEKLRRYARSFRIRCAMQNDVNGFPCGILEDLADLGVEYIWMGSNDAHTPGRLGGEPGFFWNTPRSGRKLLVWNQFMYGSGFHWFHEKLWRRGPIEPLSDPWFYAPPPGEIHAPDQIARHRQWFRSKTQFRKAPGCRSSTGCCRSIARIFTNRPVKD